jgi:cytochrome d ubiquinol oxidase subunit I
VQHYLLEARQMQALSFAAHIPLVCFGTAFPALVLFVEGLHLRTGDPFYKALAKRWSKVMILLFAVGVVSGTILSFELGLLWPRFMERFGEVFGFAFLLEGFSFFIEAIFIAIYVYGWERLPPRVHLLSGVPIVITGMTGSFMVLSVNGWMNHPTGFTLTAAGAVTHVKPLEALFNRYFWHEFVHMYLAGYVVVGFVVAAYYAFGWLRGRRDRYQRTALVVALTVAALSAPAQVIVGDWAARYVADNQPVKLAAMEGLGRTTKGAPYHVGGWYRDGEVRGGIKIPKLLSFLAHHDPNSTVIGLNSVPARDRPPVNIVRMSFVAMVASGTLMALLGVVYLLTWWWRRALPPWRGFYVAVLVCAPLSLLALIAGWVTTEVGRQPWIAYGIMRTRDAVTGASGIPVGYATLAATYAGLGVIILWFLRRLAHRPAEEPRAVGVTSSRRGVL